jgi:hypothetical protein
MKLTDYRDEADLQTLIARHPKLLASCTAAAPDDELPLLLVKREMSVRDREDGNDKWSIDHLYVDQQGVPTLVEVKRSKNPDIRRALVGQLLDYAANGAAYWTEDDLRGSFSREWGADAENKLEEFLGTDTAPEEFWRLMHDNFRKSNIRMVFVADHLPQQLRTVIEFLNEQMNDVEVLGLELRQYASDGQRVISPTIVGRTAQAEVTKGRGPAMTYEMLDNVVAEYRQIAGEKSPVDRRGGHFRQIRLGAALDPNLHFEFLQSKSTGRITCEFHAESGAFTTAVRDAIAQIAQQGLRACGAPVELVSRPRNTALRVVPSDQSDAALIAKTMRALIDETRQTLLKAAE